MLTPGDSAYSSESLTGRELLTSVKAPKLTPDEFYNCTIIRSESPTEFWVRLTGWEEKMAAITNKLRERYQNAGNPGHCEWSEGDYCAVRYPGAKDWVRALITKVREELVEVVLIDQGVTGTAPLRLIKPIPEQISKINWLSLKVEVAWMVPKDFKWSEEVLSKVQEFIECADRVAIKVSSQ